jgi:hypothetical protein
MDLEKKVKVLKKKIEELEEKVNVHYDDIGNILRFLRTKYPQDFLPGGQFKPESFPLE